MCSTIDARRKTLLPKSCIRHPTTRVACRHSRQLSPRCLRRPAWRTTKHAAQWATTLQAYAYPHRAPLPLPEATTADVPTVLTAISHDKSDAARRVRQRVAADITPVAAKRHRRNHPAGDALAYAMPHASLAAPTAAGSKSFAVQPPTYRLCPPRASPAHQQHSDSTPPRPLIHGTASNPPDAGRKKNILPTLKWK